jgi:hypothetical protein
MPKNKPETTETALVVPDDGGLPVGFVLQPKSLGGLEHVNPARLGIRSRQMRVCQGKRRRTDVGDPGQIRIDQDVFDEVRVVLLACHSIRMLREGEGDNKRTICASADGFVPHDGVAHPMAKQCAEPASFGWHALCPYAEWGDGPTGKRIPPPCSDGLAFIGMEVDRQAPPFWFVLSGTATMQGQDLLGRLGKVRGVEHLCQFIVTVKGKEVRKDKRVWYVPELLFDAEDLLPLEQYHRYAEAMADMRYVPPVTGSAAAKVEQDGDIDVEATDVTPEVDEGGVPF